MKSEENENSSCTGRYQNAENSLENYVPEMTNLYNKYHGLTVTCNGLSFDI